jgi:hypothetical protein
MMGVLQASSTHNQQGTSEMQVSHTRAAVSAAFDDENLIPSLSVCGETPDKSGLA